MVTVLIAVGLVSGTCAALAALLLVAERYLANYGQCAIDINRGTKELAVQGGQMLLASLMANSIFIPSACGGRGTCAYCKVTVTDGGGPVAPVELSLLTDAERAADVRLSCQVKVRNDLAIVIPEELFLVKEYRGVVERIRDLTDDMKEIRLRLIEPEVITFKPGQYIQLEAPAYGDNPESVYRAYSMASPPSDERNIDLIIRRSNGGISTTWVFTILAEGDEVSFNGPYGEFILADSDREMVWIAGGSGMAPFWGMVRHLREKNIQRPCTYFYGAVAKRNLALLDEFQKMEEELPNFHFVPALSAPAEEDKWTGETGLITDVLDRRLTDGAGKEYYLCGSARMIQAAVTVLKKKGVTEEAIFYDKFS
ncbi:MAG: 2Fe-2S iron-sulfur cluster binding domain-containing protein [Planctomycetia bacterium]|nr:2Fe-2S iron-sulfur cluster binding domain-containing protein [Planctomycetia bacterium]